MQLALCFIIYAEIIHVTRANQTTCIDIICSIYTFLITIENTSKLRCCASSRHLAMDESINL